MNDTTASREISTTVPRVDAEKLAQLRARLDATALPPTVSGSAGAPGPSQERAAGLLARWRDGFDWNAVEDRLESLGHITTSTEDGRTLAAIHARADESVPARIPVLLVHGWPDSPLRFVELVPLLTAAGHDVVAPSIPGFGWSTQPEGEMSRELAASDFHALMVALGYERYAVHGGDWGSAIASTIAQQNPEAVSAVHLTDVPFDLAFTIDRATASDVEVAYLDHIEKFGAESAYLIGNTMQPDLVGLTLADSPIGLAAMLASLYDAWSDDEIAADHILANATLMLMTGSVRSSMRLYSEPAQSWDTAEWEAGTGAEDGAGAEEGTETEGDAWGTDDQGWADWAPARVEAPTAFAMFPSDLASAPRELADKHFAVERFTVMPRGGHFAALEQPEALAADMTAFLADKS